MASARAIPTSVLYTGTGAKDLNLCKQKVWQDAGASEDGYKWYWLVITANTVGSAAGDISVMVDVTVE